MVVRIYPTYSYKTKPYTNDTGDENSPFPVTQEAVTKTVTEKVSQLGLTVVNTVVPPGVNAVSSSGVKDYVDGIIVTDFTQLSNEKVPSTQAVKTLVDGTIGNGNTPTTVSGIIPASTGSFLVTSDAVKNYVDTSINNIPGGGTGLTSTTIIPGPNPTTQVPTVTAVQTYVDSRPTTNIVTTTVVPGSTGNEVPTGSAVQNYVTNAINNIPGGGTGLASTTIIPGSNPTTEVPTANAVTNYVSSIISGSVGTSSVNAPSELAVKTYVDNNSSSLSSITSLPAPTGDTTSVPTGASVVSYIDSKKSTNVLDNNTNFSTSKSILNYIGSITSTNVGDNNTNFPTAAAVKSYVDNIPNSNLTSTGTINTTTPGTNVPTETAVINYLNGRVTANVSVNDGQLTTAQGVVNYLNDLRASSLTTNETTDFPTVAAVKAYVDAEDDAIEALMNNNFLQLSSIQEVVDSSSNPVTASGIKAYINTTLAGVGASDTRTDVASGSSALVTSDGIYNYVEARVAGIEAGTTQPATVVADGNANPVTSNAVYDYIHDTVIKPDMTTLNNSVVPSTNAVVSFVNTRITTEIANSVNIINELNNSSSGSNALVSASGIANFVSDSLLSYDAHAEFSFLQASGVSDQVTSSGTHVVSASGIYNFVTAQNPGTGTVEQQVQDGNNNAVSSDAVHDFVTSGYVAKSDVLDIINPVAANAISSSGVFDHVESEFTAFSSGTGYLASNYVNYFNDVIHQMSPSSTSLLTASGIYSHVESRVTASQSGLLSSGVDDIISLLPTNTLSTSAGNYIFNARAHDSTKKLGMNLGKYKFIVPAGHPIYFRRLNGIIPVFNNVPGITFHGISVAEAINNNIDSYGPFYRTEVTLEVTGPFEPFSYLCTEDGYMGGQDRLVFSDKCTPPIDTSNISFLDEMLTTMYNDPLYPGEPITGSSSGSNLPVTGSGVYEYVGNEIVLALDANTTHLPVPGDPRFMSSSGVYDYLTTGISTNFIDDNEIRNDLVTASGIYDFVSYEMIKLSDSYVNELNINTTGSGTPITGSGVYKYFKENVTDSVTTSGFTVILPPTVPVASYSSNTLTLDGSGKSYLYGQFTPAQTEIQNLIVINSIIGTQFVIQLSGSGTLSSGIANTNVMVPKNMTEDVPFEENGGIVSVFHAPNDKHYVSYVQY